MTIVSCFTIRACLKLTSPQFSAQSTNFKLWCRLSTWRVLSITVEASHWPIHYMSISSASIHKTSCLSDTIHSKYKNLAILTCQIYIKQSLIEFFTAMKKKKKKANYKTVKLTIQNNNNNKTIKLVEPISWARIIWWAPKFVERWGSCRST